MGRESNEDIRLNEMCVKGFTFQVSSKHAQNKLQFRNIKMSLKAIKTIFIVRKAINNYLSTEQTGK